MSDKFSIRLRNAGLTEVNGEIIAQGFLDIEGLSQLKVDDYQREVLKSTGVKMQRRSRLEIAVTEGARLSSIVLGMRGENFRTSGDDLLLYDNVYVVDGLQRISAMAEVAEKQGPKGLLIGAEVRFATSKETEKELFHILNTRRTPMSPNILLRNARDKNKAILTLYGLSMSDSTSPLFERVQWTQRRNIGERVTALGVAQVANKLHYHVQYKLKRQSGTAVRHTGAGAEGTMSTLDARANEIGLKTFRENVIEFFDVIDQTFGLKKIEYSELAVHLRVNFMLVLAQLFSDHSDFWHNDNLRVSAAHKSKLKTFPLDDPNVIKLAGGSNTTQPILYSLLKHHMDKGKKTNRLTARKQDVPEPQEMEAAA